MNNRFIIYLLFCFSLQYLAEIEDHLTITIPQVGTDLKVPMNEFDGKVVYGEKLKSQGSNYENHVGQLQQSLKKLTKMEEEAQLLFLKKYTTN